MFLQSFLEGIGKPPPVYETKKARSYQIELAQPAINGKNALICAPTGKKMQVFWKRVLWRIEEGKDWVRLFQLFI